MCIRDSVWLGLGSGSSGPGSSGSGSSCRNAGPRPTKSSTGNERQVQLFAQHLQMIGKSSQQVSQEPLR
eukprot:11473494-Alexandrium_andersonii.AAC.1